MSLDKRLFDLIRETVAAKGLKDTMDVINKALDLPESKFELQCPECDGLIESKAQEKGVCAHCKAEYVAFIGRCRTMKKSGPETYKKISIRYFLCNGSEALFEFRDHVFGSSLEMKSGDDFALIFTKKDDSWCSGKMIVVNRATGRKYKRDSVSVFMVQEQFPAIFS